MARKYSKGFEVSELMEEFVNPPEWVEIALRKQIAIHAYNNRDEYAKTVKMFLNVGVCK